MMVSLRKIHGIFSRKEIYPEAALLKSHKKHISLNFLRYLVLGLVCIPTMVIWAVIGSTLCGFQVASAHGCSMEPSLRDGDALWIRSTAISQLQTGDIVNMEYGADSITHRLVKKENLSDSLYLLYTKGDANSFTEEWCIECSNKVGVMIMRVPFAGYFLEFLNTVIGKVIIIELAMIMTGLWIQQRKRGKITHTTLQIR